MDTQKAREEVVAAGRLLVETGLIARTWGNVSCRIDDSRFAITPSGMYYETLEPGDIVIVQTADLSYEGDIKPSSEMGVHAEVYMQKPDAHFVIHTHQANASVAGVLGRDIDIQDPANKDVIGERAVLAGYGLPGTKKLRGNVAEALGRTDGRAVLMAHHGALCYGAGRGEAFAVAQALEDECRRCLVPVDKDQPTITIYNSRREGDTCIIETPDGAVSIGLDGDVPGDLPPQARLHQAIYRARRDITVIQGAQTPYTVAASRECVKVKPLLDDFAQIVGVSVSAIEKDADAKGAVRALKGRNALLVRGLGALCCAGSREDASAVAMVLEKGCMAHLSAAARDALTPIAPIEGRLMRFVYQQKYAKKAK